MGTLLVRVAVVPVAAVMAMPKEMHEGARDEQKVGGEPERVAPVLAQNEEQGDSQSRKESEFRVAGETIRRSP
jgi:hypothetical protein